MCINLYALTIASKLYIEDAKNNVGSFFDSDSCNGMEVSRININVPSYRLE